MWLTDGKTDRPVWKWLIATKMPEIVRKCPYWLDKRKKFLGCVDNIVQLCCCTPFISYIQMKYYATCSTTLAYFIVHSSPKVLGCFDLGQSGAWPTICISLAGHEWCYSLHITASFWRFWYRKKRAFCCVLCRGWG